MVAHVAFCSRLWRDSCQPKTYNVKKIVHIVGLEEKKYGRRGRVQRDFMSGAYEHLTDRVILVRATTSRSSWALLIL